MLPYTLMIGYGIICRSERINELLTSRSTKFIHKFSIVFPAHIVAVVMCTWFLLAFIIVGLGALNSSEKIYALELRIKTLENITKT